MKNKSDTKNKFICTKTSKEVFRPMKCRRSLRKVRDKPIFITVHCRGYTYIYYDICCIECNDIDKMAQDSSFFKESLMKNFMIFTGSFIDHSRKIKS